MDFFELVETRRSVRRYRETAVAPELQTKLLEAVRLAPTAGNFQAYEIYAIQGAAAIARVAAATFHPDWIVTAPLLLVVCTHAARCEYDNKEHWALQDASIAATYAHLAASALGLASCWVGAFVPEKLAAAANLAEGHVPMALLTVGYAAEAPEASLRRPVAEFVHQRR